MASVYEAQDAGGERVAVKILHPEMARRRDLKERFLREAYVANRIEHPGIVKILDHGDGTDVFLVLELLEGEPLSAWAQRASELTVRQLLEVAQQILGALAKAHASGVVHRDIKPDNVFVLHSGVVKILDFGIARVLDDVPSDFKTRTGMALGTIPYMAPEQALGRRGKVDGRTDLFATGALLFRLLTGRRVHEEPSEAEMLVAMATKSAPPLATVAPNVPPAVCSIVDRALAFSQADRYPDAATMQLDVREVLSGRPPPFATSAPEARFERGVTLPESIRGGVSRDDPTVAARAPEEPTRALGPSDGPTLASAAEPVLKPASVPPPSFIGSSAMGAMQVAEAQAASAALVTESPAPATSVEARPKQRSGGAVFLLAGGALVLTLFVVAIGAVLVIAPWSKSGDSAPSASAASEIPEPTGSPVDTSSREPGLGESTLGEPSATAKLFPAKTSTPKSTATAGKSSASVAPPSQAHPPSATATSASSASSTRPPPPPPPPPTPSTTSGSPSNGKSKGKGPKKDR